MRWWEGAGFQTYFEGEANRISYWIRERKELQVTALLFPEQLGGCVLETWGVVSRASWHGKMVLWARLW